MYKIKTERRKINLKNKIKYVGTLKCKEMKKVYNRDEKNESMRICT